MRTARSRPLHRVRPGELVVALAVVLTTVLSQVVPGEAIPPPSLASPRGAAGSTFGDAAAAVRASPAARAPAIAPVNVRVSHTDPSPAGEPALGVNRYGTIVVDWEDQGALQNPLGPAGMAFSNDSGASFGRNITIDTTPPSTFEYDVSTTAVSPNGTVWIGYGLSPGTCSGSFTSDTHVTAVWGNGSKWSQPIDAIPCTQTGGGFLDRDWIASTPNGTVYEVVDDSAGNVWLSQAWDGVHFSAPKAIYNNNQITIAAFAWNDTLWGVGDLSNAGCQVLLSSNTGRAWTAAPALPSGCSSSSISWDVVWGRSASLDMVYQDAAGTEFTRSTDLGAHWSNARLVSGTVPSGTAFQTPTIAADPATGSVSIVWLDTRTGTTSSTWNVYESDSADNGGTWSAVRLVSAQPAGVGAGFWPGDFIYNVLTPWGTSAAVWGGDDPAGNLQTYFGQLPVLNRSAGNLTVTVEDGAGRPLRSALVTVSGQPSRTNATGNVTYFALAPGAYIVNGSYPGLGSNFRSVSVASGTTTDVTIRLGTPPPPPLAARLSWSPRGGTAPLRVQFGMAVSGGAAPYSVTWAFGDGSPPAFGTSVVHTFQAAGTYGIQAWTNDSAGASRLNTTQLNVSAPPIPLAITASTNASVGIVPFTVSFFVQVTGGTAPISVAWVFGDGARTVDVTALAHDYLRPGNYLAHLWVNDSATPRASENDSFAITAFAPAPPPALVVTLVASPSRPIAGTVATLTAIASGGSGTYARFSWDLGDGTHQNGSASVVEHTYGVPGTYTVRVFVTDTKAQIANASLSAHIGSASPPAQTGGPASSGGPSPTWWAVGAIALVAAVAALVLYLRGARPPGRAENAPTPVATSARRR